MLDLKSISRRTEMIRSVYNFIRDNNLPEQFPELKRPFRKLEAIHRKIETLKISDPVKGPLKQLKNQLARKACIISKLVYIHAIAYHSKTYAQAFDYCISDFFRPPDVTTIGRIKQVLNAARKIKNPSYFGVPLQVIDDLEQSFKGYLNFRKTKSDTVKANVENKAKVITLISKALHLLDTEITPFIEMLSACQDKNLYSYERLRRISKKPGRKRIPKSRKKKSGKPFTPLTPKIKTEFSTVHASFGKVRPELAEG